MTRSTVWTPARLMRQLVEAGGLITAHPSLDALEYCGPAILLTPEVRSWIEDYRPELIRYLRWRAARWHAALNDGEKDTALILANRARRGELRMPKGAPMRGFVSAEEPGELIMVDPNRVMRNAILNKSTREVRAMIVLFNAGWVE